MSNIEKIKAEIERLKNIAENDNASEYLRGQARICRVILSFIDSLPEEKQPEDLEEAAEKYSDKYCSDWAYRLEYEDAFIAGAEWMRNNLPERIKK